MMIEGGQQLTWVEPRPGTMSDLSYGIRTYSAAWAILESIGIVFDLNEVVAFFSSFGYILVDGLCNAGDPNCSYLIEVCCDSISTFLALSNCFSCFYYTA